MYKLNEKIPIIITRDEENFDKACVEAYKRAIIEFKIDEYGYIHNIEGDIDRTKELAVEFKTFQVQSSMGGITFIYEYEAWIEE